MSDLVRICLVSVIISKTVTSITWTWPLQQLLSCTYAGMTRNTIVQFVFLNVIYLVNYRTKVLALSSGNTYVAYRDPSSFSVSVAVFGSEVYYYHILQLSLSMTYCIQ